MLFGEKCYLMQRAKQIIVQLTLFLQLEDFSGTSIKELKPAVLEKNEREFRNNLKNEVILLE